jgi:hypothetical protein
MVLHRTWHILYTTKQFYSLLRNFKIVSQFASWWPPSFRLLLFNFYFQVSMCMHFFWIKVSHWLANRPNWYISREYRRGRDRDSWVYNYLCNQCLPPRTLLSSNLAYGEMYSIQHYAILFVSALRQVGGFLRALQLPPPLKLTATI